MGISIVGAAIAGGALLARTLGKPKVPAPPAAPIIPQTVEAPTQQPVTLPPQLQPSPSTATAKRKAPTFGGTLKTGVKGIPDLANTTSKSLLGQ